MSPGPLAIGMRGVALVIVLWMLALLTVIAGSLTFSTRAELLIAGNLASTVKAEAAADAGVHKAIYELVTRPSSDPLRWKADGALHQWQFGEASVLIRIIDESARFDINANQEALLHSLFLSLGVSETESQALVDAILDWRDGDDFRRLHGAEREDYLAAGLTYGPANANFESIEEVRQVLGITHELFAKLAPLITVDSNRPGINASLASRQALLALPGVIPEMVDAYLQQRRDATILGQPSPAFVGAQGLDTNAPSSAITIQAIAVLGDNTAFSREAVVRLADRGVGTHTFLAWRAPANEMLRLEFADSVPFQSQ